MMWRLILAAFLMALFLALSPEGTQPSVAVEYVATPATPDGKTIFKQNCTPCHGDDGKGKAAVGTPDFTSTKLQVSLTDQYILNTITNGKTGTIMPAWKGNLSEHEISAVAAYIRSLGRAGRSE